MRFNLLMNNNGDEENLERIVFKNYIPGQKRVCFTAFVSSNLIDIIILAMFKYENYHYKTLILSDWNCLEDYNRIKNIHNNIFDEVILIKERNPATREERFKRINRQLAQINFNNIDILHIFAFNQNSFLLKLVNFVTTKTKVIQTQYTGTSYYVKEYYKQLSELYIKDRYTILRLLERIDELWIKDKELIVGDTSGIVVRDMMYYEILKDGLKLKDLCKVLNEYYGYEHRSIDSDIIFLEQPLYRYFKNDKNMELKLFKEVLDVLGKYNMIIKSHPRCKDDKYDDFDIDLFECSNVPWEVVLINELVFDNLKGKVFITYFSDALNTCHLTLSQLGIEHYSIKAVDILRTRVDIPISNNWLDKYNQKLYRKYSKNVFDVKSIDMLDEILNDITTGKTKRLNKSIMRRRNLPYIIGETAYTHEGDIDYIMYMIDMASNMGLHAIKFHLMIDVNSYFEKNHPLIDTIKGCLFSKNQWRQILNYATKKQLDIIALCDDVESIEFILEEYPEIRGIELHATSLNEVYMLDIVSNFNHEVLLGIGGSAKDEIIFAIDYLLERNKKEIILMYGFQSYPTSIEDININKMLEYASSFGLPVGYADHTAYDDVHNVDISTMPFLMGINILEKHIILKNGSKRLDYESAVDEYVIKPIIEKLALYSNILSNDDSMSQQERQYGEVGPMKKAIITNRFIKCGEIIDYEALKYRRTREISNVAQKDIISIIGMRAIKDIQSEEIIDYTMLESVEER